LDFNEENRTIRANGLCDFVIWGPEKQVAIPVGVNRVFLLSGSSRAEHKGV
jgi:hypothetical protein